MTYRELINQITHAAKSNPAVWEQDVTIYIGADDEFRGVYSALQTYYGVTDMLYKGQVYLEILD